MPEKATCVFLFSQAQQLASFPLPGTVTPHLMQGHGSQVILLASRSELVLFTIQGLQLVAFRDHQRPITSMWVVSAAPLTRDMPPTLGNPQPYLI